MRFCSIDHQLHTHERYHSNIALVEHISLSLLHTGRSDSEFNLRHDWNSLLGADPSVAPVTNRTAARWPPADVLLSYLRDYASAQEAAGKIAYNVTVVSISPFASRSTESGCSRRRRFLLTLDRRDVARRPTRATAVCSVVVMATGLGEPNVPTSTVDGVEHATLYRDLPPTGESFQGQSVAVLGAGNAAFETADALAPYVAYVHVWKKGRRARAQTADPLSFLSWES